MAYVQNELLKCVAFLGYINQEGKEKFAGSAFWISRSGPEDIKHEYRPAYLVTAAHVIEDVQKKAALGDNRVRVRVNTRDGTQKWEDTPLHSWRVHPDPSVDVAVLKIGIGESVDHTAWPTEWFVSDQSMEDDGRRIELGDELFFAGLFWPHRGEKRNIPIVRVGNVAALRGEPVLNRDGKLMDAYLVESRSIGGLSGSPVFIDVISAKQEFVGERSFRTGKWPSKYRLMGIVHGHFDSSDLEPDTAADDREVGIGVNMGIAIVVPADKIIEALSAFTREEENEADEFRKRKPSVAIAGGQQPNVTFGTFQTTSAKPEKTTPP